MSVIRPACIPGTLVSSYKYGRIADVLKKTSENFSEI